MSVFCSGDNFGDFFFFEGSSFFCFSIITYAYIFKISYYCNFIVSERDF